MQSRRSAAEQSVFGALDALSVDSIRFNLALLFVHVHRIIGLGGRKVSHHQHPHVGSCSRPRALDRELT